MCEAPAKKQKMANSLEQLKNFTIVVADTGDFEGNLFSVLSTASILIAYL